MKVGGSVFGSIRAAGGPEGRHVEHDVAACVARGRDDRRLQGARDHERDAGITQHGWGGRGDVSQPLFGAKYTKGVVAPTPGCLALLEVAPGPVWQNLFRLNDMGKESGRSRPSERRPYSFTQSGLLSQTILFYSVVWERRPSTGGRPLAFLDNGTVPRRCACVVNPLRTSSTPPTHESFAEIALQPYK